MPPNAATVMCHIVLDPVPAFKAALQRPQAGWPLLAVVGGTTLIYALYFLTLDFGWFVDHALRAKPELSDAQRAAVREVLQPTMLTVWSLLTAVVVPVLVFALLALYYLLAAQLLGHRIGYGHWFAFCAWTAVPRVLAYPLMLYQIASSHGQVALEDLSMLSLNFLLLHRPPDHAWAGLASAVDLTALWSLAVSVVGFRAWTGERWATSAAVSLAPSALVYGLWALRVSLGG